MLGSTTNQKCFTFGYLLHMWFRAIRVPICVFWSLCFMAGMLKHYGTVDCEFSQLNIGWSKRQWVRGYHSGWCKDTPGGFLENFWTQYYFLHLLKYHNFWSISFQIKGILLYMFQSHTMMKMKIIHTHCMFRHVCTIFMSKLYRFFLMSGFL